MRTHLACFYDWKYRHWPPVRAARPFSCPHSSPFKFKISDSVFINTRAFASLLCSLVNKDMPTGTLRCHVSLCHWKSSASELLLPNYLPFPTHCSNKARNNVLQNGCRAGYFQHVMNHFFPAMQHTSVQLLAHACPLRAKSCPATKHAIGLACRTMQQAQHFKTST